ncbi:hypothetical protein ACHAQH_007786 [Verticillium albo-atrum]
MTQTPHFRIASVPADSIGPEAISSAIAVVNTLTSNLKTFTIEFTHLPWVTAHYKEHGRYIPKGALDTLRTFDAGLFAIRSPLQLYDNVRPVRTFPGTHSPLKTTDKRGIDWMIIRENSEDEYTGQGGRSHVGQDWETATEVAIFTRRGFERIMRFAFEAARSRAAKRLTVVTKSNSMRNGMVLWDEVAARVATDFPDVTWDKMLVDAMTVRMIAGPYSVDTIVGTNLHMDIISDMAAALAGSIGAAPSSNLDPTKRNPSLFEPVHGSAGREPYRGDLVGGGDAEAADKLMSFIERVCEAGCLTPDLGGKASTKEVEDAVKRDIEKHYGG